MTRAAEPSGMMTDDLLAPRWNLLRPCMAPHSARNQNCEENVSAIHATSGPPLLGSFAPDAECVIPVNVKMVAPVPLPNESIARAHCRPELFFGKESKGFCMR
mmetsp:Transcript_18880/g.57067  ORF Transcript_18880/g.57067 Transcript_18880/m.57067 type:complete len:103 (-) Transcript_18880:2134-2442(-)